MARASKFLHLAALLLPLGSLVSVAAQTAHPANIPMAETFTEADRLRGSYGPYRSNNDLLYYHLDVRVDPAKKSISGKNSVRFKMLEDGQRIQLDLVSTLQIDKVLFDKPKGATTPLHFERAAGRTVYIDFPRTLPKGETDTIEVFYSGHPVEMGRFGGIVFRKDPMGRPLVNTACEEEGASVWWPNKDQWRDEVESMDLSVEAPSDLVEVSGGKFQGKTDLHDGFTRWDWKIQYPINNYDVSLNIGTYVHFSDTYKTLPLDYFVFPEDIEKAKHQFVQAKHMLKAYEHYFGEYPFLKDGYKLVEALYSGVENQTAITYGNHFENGYLGRPRTGIGTRFDFIIIHESAHEYFGNSITAKDRSDMWIHEGWANYCEGLFVEFMWGKSDGITYVNTGKENVKNQFPVISQEGVFSTPPGDQYKKGGLFLNTLRSVVGDDVWFPLLHDYYQHFKYQTIMTTDMVAFFNQQTKMDLTPIFNQYLRHAAIPVLQLRFDDAAHTVSYRWQADEAAFAMPIRVGSKENWQLIYPTTSEWKTLSTPLTKDQFEVATDMYYVGISKE
ncbi:M1 family metallopeptidase [Granulicella tundricola]|uniref:Peptidase M1 membrane alanine aminopeptidase n=1 Tax=Granulicella tundricola (strain ATCC BAA-1859 / DSM 23138 / MP5ACTX9) TaxID=1198114 RepID=E8X6E3_GRATM|nr:M1 family metallopeptidase [Granulicella tundricola]ADW71027.1 Peptidase M1 membrane alanine aminopeptidase [Granulicella tundricola MP5ACTX9]